MTSTYEPEGLRDPAPDAPPLPPSRGYAPPPPAAPSTPGPLARFPALAAFLSLIPGLGHLYVGAYQSAATIVIGIIAILIVVPLPVNVFLSLFVWFFGIFDAYRQAQLLNLGVASVPLPAARDRQGTLAFGVFLAVVGALLLLHNFDLIGLEWLRDWWPAVPLAVGVYLVVSALVQRRRPAAETPPESEG